MKKFFLRILLVCIFLVPIAYSQEISEEFLKTLPPEIRSDVLNRIDDQETQTDPTYSSIKTQTKIDKEELEDETAEDDFIRNIDDLMVFGSDFFRTYQSTYMPINEPNLSGEYILDFGDTLEIQLVGQKNYQQKNLHYKEMDQLIYQI